MDVNDLWGDLPGPGPGEGQEVQFACERGDFLPTQDRAVLGSFDGRDARDLHAYAVPPGEAQLLVSLHEHLHHELQWSTAWGLVAAMAGLLADAGVDPDRLRPVSNYANKRARHVHEVFATTVSVGVLSVQRGRELLTGNRRYLRFLDQGLSLGGDSSRWPWQFRESAAQMLLRNLMQPRELLAVAVAGFEGLNLDSLTHIAAPDARLLKSNIAGSWWTESFENLLALDPTRGGDKGGTWNRSLPSNQTDLERLKEYEESLLIPHLATTARSKLGELEIACLDDSEYLDTITMLRASFTKVAPPGWQVEVLSDRRPFSQEPLGAERERVHLHAARAIGDLASGDDVADPRFVLRSVDGRPAVLCTYFPGRTLATQFGLTELAAVPAVLSLAGWPFLDDEGQRHVPLALLAPPATPAGITQAFERLPVLVLTSLTLTRIPEPRKHVLALSSSFILVDLPLNLQVSYWVADGWTVRFATIDLHGEHGLMLLLFVLDELPGLHFLAYRSVAGFAELVQLLDRHQGKLMTSLQPDADTLRDVTTISSWLLSAWWRLQEAENLDG